MRREVATIMLPRDRYENFRCCGVVKEWREDIFSGGRDRPWVYTGIEGEEEVEEVKDAEGSWARWGAGLQK